MNVTDPRVFLVADNCFAIKRWVQPREWLAVAADLGLRYVQASTDNEFDALYSDPAYMRDWVAEVHEASKETGVQVRSVYTGYQTYRTSGLGHPDTRVRDRIVDGWIKPTINHCAELGAELGFHLFAYPETVLQDRHEYLSVTDRIIDDLAAVAQYAAEHQVRVSVEQMYSPHQPPWTIAQAEYFVAEVYRRADVPCYVTIDTGHQVGQRAYLRPTEEQVRSLVADGAGSDLWLGSASAYQALADGDADAAIAAMDGNPQYFSDGIDDADLYAWVRALGRYSPLMHLQQTDGTGSHHAPFTTATNSTGIVHPAPLLRALAESFSADSLDGMPPDVDTVSLSFEIFSGSAENRHQILSKMRESIEYWRQAIPVDGMRLSELIDHG